MPGQYNAEDWCPHGVRWTVPCPKCNQFANAQQMDNFEALGELLKSPLNMPDDQHYADLGKYQPTQVFASWAEHGKWPAKYIYRITEAMMAVVRVGGKGQDVRDLRKAARLLDWVADEIENIGGTKP